MNDLHRHEIFEMDVLDALNSGQLLDRLVFGGGTMLRLCYELNRYSADLDFWFIKKTDPKTYFKKVRSFLSGQYELTDAKSKFYTLLFELRSPKYPKRLKIEIRKETRQCDFQDRIAYSKYSTKQVILKAHTLEQTMANKIEAALDRKEVRDFFDMEFLLRKGVNIAASEDKLTRLVKIARSFRKSDFAVTLGSVLDPDMRSYYSKNGFSFFIEQVG